MLFGSRARAIRAPIRIMTSRYFSRTPGTLAAELHRLASISTEIHFDTGAVISAKPSNYSVGPTLRPISTGDADGAINTAERFISCIAELLT